MTRRRVYFYDQKQNKLYSTPEFNGDKEEFVEFRKAEDSCDKNFNEILREFEGVKTFEEFKKASNKAQSYYHSFLGDTVLPIEEKVNIEYNDEVYMINKEGDIYLYNPEELNREYLLNVANKGEFIYQDLTMNCEKFFSKVLEEQLYFLDIYPIENIITKQSYRLGTIEDFKIEPDLDNKLKKEIEDYINRVAKMKRNLEREPIKLKPIYSLDHNFPVAFQSELGNKYILYNQREAYSIIKVDSRTFGFEYNLDLPITIGEKTLSPIFDTYLEKCVYDKNQLDVAALEMSAKINEYMVAWKNDFDMETINRNLNYIYENIYNKDKIDEYFFEKYKDMEYIKDLQNKYYNFLNNKESIENIEEEEEEM